MNYLKRKELLESQGWTARDKKGNEVVFVKNGVYGLLIVVDCITGDYKVYDYCPKDYLNKNLPKLEKVKENENKI